MRNNIYHGSCFKYMLFAVGLLLPFLLISTTLSAQSTARVDSVEAEFGILTGVSIGSSTQGYSGTGYVTGFDQASDQLKIAVTVKTKGFYQLVIRYNATSGNKTQKIAINSDATSDLLFPQTTKFTNLDAGKYLLQAGRNTITISNSWGWVDLDRFMVYSAERNVYNITQNLIDPNATAATKALYSYLTSHFGKKIISGVTNDYYDKTKTVAGKGPMLRSWDFTSYTAGYPWSWSNAANNGAGGHVIAANPDGSTENAIKWYNDTNNEGIVNFHWHWCSPSGGTAGVNTFYTQYTTFDITQAVISGTTENTLVLRDIDVIAGELKKLQDAGIPVLWRPLHEAGGGWFWWGAKGATACKQMFDIIYDRLTNHFGLHNLIWEWSTPETDWYPGNSKIDIVGYDSYPGVYNYGTQKNMFDVLYKLTGGTKLITMSEDGPIPNINDCLTLDSPWSYFMTWSDLTQKQNTDVHIQDTYKNDFVLSLGSLETAPSLTVGAPTLQVASNAGETAVTVTSNQVWTVSSDQTWIAPGDAVGLGNNPLNLIYSANTSASTRTANITISAPGLTPQTITVTQAVAGPTGISDKEEDAISIFPNPTSNKLYISGLRKITLVSIYSATGVLVSKQLADNKVDVTELNNGIYLIRFETENGIVVKRFVKQ